MSYFEKFYEKGREKIDELKRKYQDPVKEFEKQVRRLKEDFETAKKTKAYFLSLKLRSEKDLNLHAKKVKEYSAKAEETIAKQHKGELSQEAAERVAMHALTLKSAYEERITELKLKIPKYDEEISELTDKIEFLKDKVSHYESELEALKIKNQTNTAKKETKKDMFHDDSDALSRLEKLKQKAKELEVQSDFYEKYSDHVFDEEFNNSKIKEELEDIKNKYKK